MPQMWLFQLTSRRRKDVMAKNQDKALLYALDYMQNKITKKPLYPKPLPLYYNPPPRAPEMDASIIYTDIILKMYHNKCNAFGNICICCF